MFPLNPLPLELYVTWYLPGGLAGAIQLGIVYNCLPRKTQKLCALIKLLFNFCFVRIFACVF